MKNKPPIQVETLTLEEVLSEVGCKGEGSLATNASGDELTVSHKKSKFSASSFFREWNRLPPSFYTHTQKKTTARSTRA